MLRERVFEKVQPVKDLCLDGFFHGSDINCDNVERFKGIFSTFEECLVCIVTMTRDIVKNDRTLVVISWVFDYIWNNANLAHVSWVTNIIMAVVYKELIAYPESELAVS